MNSRSFSKEFEKAKEDLDQRLTSKHVRTLTYLQEKSYENDELRHRVSELEGYKMKADYYAGLQQQVDSLQVSILQECFYHYYLLTNYLCIPSLEQESSHNLVLVG